MAISRLPTPVTGLCMVISRLPTPVTGLYKAISMLPTPVTGLYMAISRLPTPITGLGHQQATHARPPVPAPRPTRSFCMVTYTPLVASEATLLRVHKVSISLASLSARSSHTHTVKQGNPITMQTGLLTKTCGDRLLRIQVRRADALAGRDTYTSTGIL